jgi:hypothetical protein
MDNYFSPMKSHEANIKLNTKTNTKLNTKTNTKTMKNTGMKNRTRTAKRNRNRSHTTNYSKIKKNSRIRIVNKANVSVSKTNIEKALQLYFSLKEVPMYLILGHACICPTSGLCFDETPKNTEFAIPNNTYFVNFAQPGDFYCGSTSKVLKNMENIRSYLSLHSESDIPTTEEVGKTKFSFFSGVQRATSSDDQEPVLYPNIAFSFNKDDGNLDPTNNDQGVYVLPKFGKLNNTMSILPQDANRKNWFLEDIVQEVYEKTGANKGIFLLAGCLSICSLRQKMSDLNHAAELIHLANVRYTSLRETFTQEEMIKHIGIEALPRDEGTYVPVSTMSPMEIQHMTNLCVTCPRRIMEIPYILHGNNLEKVRSMANTITNN